MTQLQLPMDDSAPASSPPSTVRPPPEKRKRGFAAMDREKVREIARKGGRAAHAQGKAHQFTPEEAKRAGIKGGRAPHVRRGRGKRSP